MKKDDDMKRKSPLLRVLCLWLVLLAGAMAVKADGLTTLSDNRESATRSTASEPAYQLVVWKKNGQKTGYLFADHPRFQLRANDILFTTDKVSFSISLSEFDKFTLELAAPQPASQPLYRFYVWLRNGTIESYAIDEKPLVTLGDEVFTLTTSSTSVGYVAKDVLRFTLNDSAAEKTTYTLADAIAITYYILGNAPIDLDPVAADVNKDGKINIADVVKIVSTLTKAQSSK